jgi:hypothetical protein
MMDLMKKLSKAGKMKVCTLELVNVYALNVIGYVVTYLPMGAGGKIYATLIRSLSNNLSKELIIT